MRKIAIIGASYLQLPLINKAKELGYVTHVFAWAADDVGEKAADYFYPISIVEKELILEKCLEIEIDGITSIASDLAAITVNYVAEKMELAGNPMDVVNRSTNKHLMRQCFEAKNVPSPKSFLVESSEEIDRDMLTFPVIVKPLDRSGSRGITKCCQFSELENAIQTALDQGFIKKALVEEFAEGREYSVECISYHGQHTLLAITEKYTTGSPHFIETAHIEPAGLSAEMEEKVKAVTFHALTSLGIENSASHTELKIDDSGNIKVIEIGGRMGGDCIGSDLVCLSTGIDFTKAVIDVAMDQRPDLQSIYSKASSIRYIFGQDDIKVLEKIQREYPEYLVRSEVYSDCIGEITDSGSRYGYFLMQAERRENLLPFLPAQRG